MAYRVLNALTLLGLGLALAARPGEAAAEWNYGAEAGLFHDNNLSQALAASDIVSDTALNLAVSGGYYFVLGDRDTVNLSADLRSSNFSRFHGMNNVALGASASWRTKFGVGAFVPWTALSASYAGEQYGDSIRNGRRTGVTLRAGERLSERLELSGGGVYDRYRAEDVVQVVPGLSGDAFSVEGRSLFMRADYMLNERWLGFALVSARRGDVTASTRRDLEIFEYSSAVTLDPAFGTDYIAYKITGATTWDFIAGLSLALGERSSVNVAVTRALTYASGGLDYQSTLINASVIFSY